MPEPLENIMAQLENLSQPDSSPQSAQKASERVEQQQPFDLMQETHSLLDEMNINLDPSKEDEKHLISFLSTHMFDHGSIEDLDPLPDSTVSKFPNVTNEKLPGVAMLSSGMLRQLTEVNPKTGKPLYNAKMMIDISNLNGANGIKRLNGDRLIRTVGRYLHDKLPGHRFVKWGGDEIVILSKDEGAFSEDQQKELFEDVQKMAFLYRSEEGEIVDAPVQFKEKEIVPFAKNTSSHDSVEARFDSVAKMFPHLKSLKEIFSLERKTEEEQTHLLELVENAVYHPVIQEYAKDYPQVQVYKEVSDFISFLEYLPPEYTTPQGKLFPLHYKTVRFEWPGMLKIINDNPQNGYNEGNQFLVDRFTESAAYISHGSLPTVPVPMLCRGTDFYMMIPVQMQRTFDRRSLGEGTIKRVNNIDYEVTMAAVTAPVNEKLFKKTLDHYAMGKSEKDDIVSEMMSELGENSKTMVYEIFYRKMRTQLESERFDSPFMNFIFDYFSAGDKRGISRLVSLDIPSSLRQEWKKLYKNGLTFDQKKTIATTIHQQLYQYLGAHGSGVE